MMVYLQMVYIYGYYTVNIDGIYIWEIYGKDLVDNKPASWEWFIAPIYSDLGDCFTHISEYR